MAVPHGPHQIRAAMQWVLADIEDCENACERLPQLREQLADLRKKLDWWERPDEEGLAEDDSRGPRGSVERI